MSKLVKVKVVRHLDRCGHLLSSVETYRRVRKSKSRAIIAQLTFNGVTIKGRLEKMELREGQKVRARVKLLTKSGHPAKYQTGSEQWSSNAPNIASVTVDPANPLEADIEGLDGSGNDSVLVQFTADGDPDDDQTRDVVATLDVVVTQGEAVVAEIETDTPTDA